jgi:hypothetical protein
VSRSKKTVESKTKKEITDALTKMNIRWFRMQSGMVKRGSHYIHLNKTGTPDLLILRGGHALWVELKAPGEKQSAEQVEFQSRAECLGERYITAISLAEVIEKGLR